MSKKVILVSIDGMRPDGLKQCGNPYVEELQKKASYTFSARTVYPSITLPCHMSLFHSVPPERHGTVTNLYVPQSRPISGLCEQLKYAGKVSGIFYGWDPIRDVARPDSMMRGEFIFSYSFDHTDDMLTDSALEYIKCKKPDFVFLYMVETDQKGGHDHGWMSEPYLDCISRAISNVKRVIESVGDEYTVIVTADHGGHDRDHGSDMDEDMTIPMIFYGEDFEAGKELKNISILDIAPTIADIMSIQIPREWEGKSILSRDKI
ncbi:MAG: alkaline phosphatase family protein [Clostridia bacterium]|nr:alkaline phosphatase family protein [Clostridia bacterium]